MTESFKPYTAKVVDPETSKLAGDCAAQIAVELGESPEAWRGAASMARFIQAVVMADVDSTIDATGEFAINESGLVQLLTVAMLQQLPMWPPEDEPLLVDDHPAEPRAHFRGFPNGG